MWEIRQRRNSYENEINGINSENQKANKVCEKKRKKRLDGRKKEGRKRKGIKKYTSRF
jgi:hypothetical protein